MKLNYFLHQSNTKTHGTYSGRSESLVITVGFSRASISHWATYSSLSSLLALTLRAPFKSFLSKSVLKVFIHRHFLTYSSYCVGIDGRSASYRLLIDKTLSFYSRKRILYFAFKSNFRRCLRSPNASS